MSENKRHYRRGSLVWPILLIGLGVIFLLNNLGIVSWDIWLAMLRLWPLLLVAIGLDILLGRRSGVWSIVSIVLIISLFAGGAWLVQSTKGLWYGEITTLAVSHPIDVATNAEVDVDFGVGELEIGKSSEPGALVDGDIDISEDETLVHDFSIEGTSAYLDLGSTGQEYFPSWIYQGNKDHKTWSINLTDQIPLDLNVNTGIGQATIDLEGMQLEELNIDSGIGETIVYLPDSGSFTASISLGIGELVVYVPEELIVRIHLDTGLGDNSISGDYDQSGNVYYSPDYDETGEWVELYVDGGIGEVRVVQQ